MLSLHASPDRSPLISSSKAFRHRPRHARPPRRLALRALTWPLAWAPRVAGFYLAVRTTAPPPVLLPYAP
jgi:hypothetical protein